MPRYLAVVLSLMAGPLIPVVSAQGTAADDRYAVLVGLSDYPGDEEDLGGGPLNDVALMAHLLVNRLGFPRANILILADEDATWLNIVKAFSSHLSRASENGVALFYYSGHGAQLPNRGADLEGDGLDEVLVTLGSAEGSITPVRDDELGLLTTFLRTDRVLVVLDNCYSGTGTRGARGRVSWRDVGRHVTLPSLPHVTGGSVRRPSAKRMTKAAVARMVVEPPSAIGAAGDTNEPRKHVLLAASAEHEVSLNVPFMLDDGSRVPVGLFTATLYAELNRADLGTTSFSELARSLQATTRLVTARLGEAPQTPRAEGARRNAFIGPFLGLR